MQPADSFKFLETSKKYIIQKAELRHVLRSMTVPKSQEKAFDRLPDFAENSRHKLRCGIYNVECSEVYLVALLDLIPNTVFRDYISNDIASQITR